jgi:hypothetical protein
VSKHDTITPDAAADRLAIRELVEAYAHCADRRDAKGPGAALLEPPQQERQKPRPLIYLTRRMGSLAPRTGTTLPPA